MTSECPVVFTLLVEKMCSINREEKKMTSECPVVFTLLPKP